MCLEEGGRGGGRGREGGEGRRKINAPSPIDENQSKYDLVVTDNALLAGLKTQKA